MTSWTHLIVAELMIKDWFHVDNTSFCKEAASVPGGRFPKDAHMQAYFLRWKHVTREMSCHFM